MAMLYFTTQLTVRDRSRLLGLLSALALLSVVVGVLQLVSGNGNWFQFYGSTNYGFATGFQASRNAQADLLIISSMAFAAWAVTRSEEHTSELQSLMRISYAVFCLKKKKNK